MRTFIGVPITDEIRKKIWKISKNFDIKGIKLVNPENLHWTIKFFGDIREEEINEIKEIMDKLNFDPFNIEIGGIGTFPSLSYIKTIWIGVRSGKESFEKFLKRFNEKFSDIGKINNHEIKAHLTIGRVKFIEDKEKLINLIKIFGKKDIGEMKINKISLFESILTGDAPKYNILKEVVLK